MNIIIDFQNLKDKVKFDGFYKFNSVTQSIKRIGLPESVAFFKAVPHMNNIICAVVSEDKSEYISKFYSLDFSENINVLYTKKIKKVWVEGPYSESARTVFGRLKAYPIDNDFMIFLEDEINHPGECYDLLSISNSYRFYICKSGISGGIEVYDQTIFKDGIGHIDIFNINKRKYILLKTGLISFEDKMGAWNYYRNNKEYRNEIRGFDDSLKLIEVEQLVSYAELHREKIPYKQIETIGLHGSIYFLKRNGPLLHYGVKNYEMNRNELVCYNIYTNSYQRYNIPFSYEHLIYDGKKVYALIEDNAFMNLIGINSNIKLKYPKDIGLFVAMVDNQIITERWQQIGEKGVQTYDIFDIKENIIVKTITGKINVEFFEKENAIIAY